jgi:hypothetical protein
MTSFSSREQIRLSGDALHLKEKDAWFKPRILPRMPGKPRRTVEIAICSIDRQDLGGNVCPSMTTS